MLSTLYLVLPVFILVLIGYIIGGTSLFPKEGRKALTNFVYYVAVPALLFRSMAEGAMSGGVDVTMLVAFYSCGLMVLALAGLVGKVVFKLPTREATVFAMGSSFGNTVLLGIPIVNTAYGEAGATLLYSIIAFHALILMTIPMMVLEVTKGPAASFGAILKEAAGSLYKNPIILGLAAGIAWSFTGYGLSDVVSDVVDKLADAATPAALFALGTSLSNSKIEGVVAHALTMTFIKLVVHPLMALGFGVALGLEGLPLAIMVLTAALPAGNNVFIVASTFSVFLRRAVAAIILTTMLAVLSTTAVIEMIPIGP
ncbi:MAG: AEC family transporter [Alphaproteobacteria bacterium]|nr:AEC family transporter [Alphaproteobacteria bacterium]